MEVAARSSRSTQQRQRGPTAWWGRRVVGGWTSGVTREIVWLLLEDVGMQAREAIGSEAASLQEWLGDVRIRPGSPPPLRRALAE